MELESLLDILCKIRKHQVKSEVKKLTLEISPRDSRLIYYSSLMDRVNLSNDIIATKKDLMIGISECKKEFQLENI